MYRPKDYASGAQTMEKGTLTLQFHKLGLYIDHYNAVLVAEQQQETYSDTSLEMVALRVQQASSEIKVKAHRILPLPHDSLHRVQKTPGSK